MREVRMLLLASLLALPLSWSAATFAETKAETINQVLSALHLGTLPLLGAMLYWEESFRGADIDVRYGASRRVFAAKSLGRCSLALVAFSVLTSLGALAFLRGPRDALLFKDALATLPIALASGLAVSCFLAMGRAWFGKWGLSLLLLALWLLAPLDSSLAALVPTGHVRHLLGVGAELPLPGWGSFGCLYAMAGLSAAALFARVPG